MASSVIRFEVELPNTDAGTPQNAAIQTFLTSMQTLAHMFIYQSNDVATGLDFMTVKGYITSGQAAAALGFLTTLNTALGSNVYCVTMAATSQP